MNRYIVPQSNMAAIGTNSKYKPIELPDILLASFFGHRNADYSLQLQGISFKGLQTMCITLTLYVNLNLFHNYVSNCF